MVEDLEKDYADENSQMNYLTLGELILEQKEIVIPVAIFQIFH